MARLPGSIGGRDSMDRSSLFTWSAMRYCGPLWKCSGGIIRLTNIIWAVRPRPHNWSVSPSWQRAWCCCGCCHARRGGREDSIAKGGRRLAAKPLDGFQSFGRPCRPIVLSGPTAVGKSEVAIRLAEFLNGEIICVDSMQVYRGMDIGTAKPSASERASVPHHLLDVAELTESFDAAQFTRLAHRVVSEIQARNRVPILCGGTGLYFKAYLYGLGETPPGDP